MENKIIKVMAKMVVYTCLTFAGATLIFLLAGVAAAALRFMLGAP